MKIVQSVFGKFHHFHLARQLHKRGLLEKIYSTYPRWKLKEESIPSDKIDTFPWIQTFLAAKWRYGIINEKLDKELNWRLFESFDNYIAQKMPACDVYIGISASGLHAGTNAKKRGIKYICDRGSSHIKYANSIIGEEYKRWDMKFDGIDQRLIEKEEKEYHLADIITIPSKFVYQSFIEFGVPAGKLKMIPYGADLNNFAVTGKPLKESFDVLFVGQVSLRKGVPYLLSAFSKFKHPGKRLRLVGSIYPGMDKIFKMNDMNAVEILGPVPHTKLKYIMSESHVMVLPSIEEGLALVQGQAMACGCPLISTTNTGGEDLFTNGKEGYIIPIRDPAAITEKLEFLAQNPKIREEMSCAALARVKKIGGWDFYGEQFVKLCQEIIKS